MNKVVPIFRREISSYFFSPVAYIVISVFLLIVGWFFSSELFLANEASLRSVFSFTPFVFIFFIPAITMRLMSEEQKSGTIELLFTMPISDIDIVLGKYLAGLGLLMAALAFTFPYALTVMFFGEPDMGMLVSGYLGLILMGASYVAIGMFASTVSKNQVVSFIIAFFIIFSLFMLNKFLILIPPRLVPVFQYLSIDYHFENISRGVIDSRDIVYYLSLIVFMLSLAKLSLESRKWS
ncbi:MAG: ABC transporter permease [Candidatus Latescibacteria bacterium]|nr:ABC transporter permease [Candidatus Latescibacterota bacterium]